MSKDRAARAQPLSPAFRWMVLASISLTCFAQYFIYDSITPLGATLSTQLGLSDAQYGLLFTYYAVPNVLLGMLFLAGILVDRLGIRVSGVIYAALCVLGAGLTALGTFGHDLPNLLGGLLPVEWTPQLRMMLLGRMVFGVGAEAILVVNNKVLARWFSGKELSFAYGVNLAIMRLGTLLAMNTMAPAASKLGLPRSLLFATGLMAMGLLAFLLYLMLEKLGAGRAHAPKTPLVASTSDGASGAGDRFHWGQLVSFSPSFWLITFLCLAFYSAVLPFQSFAPKVLAENFHFTDARAASIASTLTWGTAIFTPILGLFVDKRGKRTSLMLLGSFVLIPSLLSIALTGINPILPLALIGVSLSLVPAALWASVPMMVPEARLGTAFGIIGYIQNVGLMLFPWIAGLISDAHRVGERTDYTWTILLFVGLGLFGFVCALLLKIVDKKNGSPLERPSGASAPEQIPSEVSSSAC